MMKPLSPRDRQRLLTEYFLNAYLISMILEFGKRPAKKAPPKPRKTGKAEMEVSVEALLKDLLE